MDFSNYAIYFGFSIFLIFIIYLISLLYINRNCYKSLLSKIEN